MRHGPCYKDKSLCWVWAVCTSTRAAFAGCFKLKVNDRVERDLLPRLYIGICSFLSLRHVVDSFT